MVYIIYIYRRYKTNKDVGMRIVSTIARNFFNFFFGKLIAGKFHASRSESINILILILIRALILFALLLLLLQLQLQLFHANIWSYSKKAEKKCKTIWVKTRASRTSVTFSLMSLSKFTKERDRERE